MKELYTVAFSGAILLAVYFMYKEVGAKSPDAREKYLDDEKAVATVATTLLPMV